MYQLLYFSLLTAHPLSLPPSHTQPPSLSSLSPSSIFLSPTPLFILTSLHLSLLPLQTNLDSLDHAGVVATVLPHDVTCGNAVRTQTMQNRSGESYTREIVEHTCCVIENEIFLDGYIHFQINMNYHVHRRLPRDTEKERNRKEKDRK